MTPPELFNFLQQHGIQFERYDHPPVFTCEEARILVPKLPAAETKNLFLRDKKGERHFLVCVGAEQRIDLTAMASQLGSTKLSFASPDRLMRYLGVAPGSVTLLALCNDHEKQVELWIDQSLWQEEAFLCHPLINTSTLVMSKAALTKFFQLLNIKVRILPPKI